MKKITPPLSAYPVFVLVFSLMASPSVAFTDCSDCPEMINIPAGSYLMGSPNDEQGRWDDEGPQHRVTILKPFSVAIHHTTVNQFSAFVSASGFVPGSSCWTVEDRTPAERSGRSWQNPGYAQEGNHPVTCISWNDAQAYVSWLSNKTNENYRLLTEAEWEYAARGGTTTRYFFGDDETKFCEFGNGGDLTTKEGIEAWRKYEHNNLACRDGYVFTAPVGSFRPNPFGLFDMHGNVWTWVADCRAGRTYGSTAVDGSAVEATNCGQRISRGGAWDGIGKRLRSAARISISPSYRGNTNGLRVAKTTSTPQNNR